MAWRAMDSSEVGAGMADGTIPSQARQGSQIAEGLCAADAWY
jgi:hypothetical protein